MLGRIESCSYTRELSPALVSNKWASDQETVDRTGSPSSRLLYFHPLPPSLPMPDGILIPTMCPHTG